MTPLHAGPWKINIDFSTKHYDNFRFIIRWGHLWPSLVENCILLKTAKLNEIFERKLVRQSLFKMQVCTLSQKWPQNRAFKWDILCFLPSLVLAPNRKNGILCLKFSQDLHENDADEVMTSPWHMSTSGVKSSNVYSFVTFSSMRLKSKATSRAQHQDFFHDLIRALYKPTRATQYVLQFS